MQYTATHIYNKIPAFVSVSIFLHKLYSHNYNNMYSHKKREKNNKIKTLYSSMF